MRPLQGLICDLEGTLVDGAVDIRAALNTVMRAQNRRDLSLEDVRKTLDQGTMALLEHAFLLTGGLPQDDVYPFVKDFIGAYRSVPPDPAQIYPHVPAILETCKKAGVKIGLCTNKPEAASKHLLQAIGLDAYFDFVAGGDTFPCHKPHPDHLAGILRALAVRSETSVMVGDSLNDIQAAKGAGMACIVVVSGQDGDVAPVGADASIESFASLPQALEKLGFDLPVPTKRPMN